MNDLATELIERHTLISPVDMKDVILRKEDISIMSSRPWHIHYNYLPKDFKDWRIGDQVVTLVVLQGDDAQVVLTSKVLVLHMCMHHLIEIASDDGTIIVIRGTENGKIPPREIYT